MEHWSKKQKRCSGKFTSDKQLRKITRAKKGIRPRKAITDVADVVEPNIPDSEINFKGRRIVDIDIMAKNLFCRQCSQRIFLENISNEKRHGALSTFQIKCLQCHAVTNVISGKTHEVPTGLSTPSKPESSPLKPVIHSDTNEMLILGIYSC